MMTAGSVGLPMSAVTLLVGWLMSGRIQKMTEGKLRYEAGFSFAIIVMLLGRWLPAWWGTALNGDITSALSRLGRRARQYYSLRSAVPDSAVKRGYRNSARFRESRQQKARLVA
ncbi:conserved hypothetical protein [Enterobacterales bacterium 8AC]|nr:conserved hypothetical protein [Enterobacterales bacterium 8AC]